MKATGIFIIIQRILLVLGVLSVIVVTVLFGLPYQALIITVSVLMGALFLFVSKRKGLSAIILAGAGFCTVVHLFLNLCFYPALLQYQSGETAAKWFNENISSPQLGLFKIENTSLKFYANTRIIATDTLPVKARNNSVVQYYFTTKNLFDSLSNSGFQATAIETFQNFHITKLKFGFINKNTRASQLDTTVIFKIDNEKNESFKMASLTQ